jgi:hypothetical protein
VTARKDWQMRFAEGIAAGGIRGINDEFAHEPERLSTARGHLFMRLWARLRRGKRRR